MLRRISPEWAAATAFLLVFVGLLWVSHEPAPAPRPPRPVPPAPAPDPLPPRPDPEPEPEPVDPRLAVETELLAAHNRERKGRDLVFHPALVRAARSHADWMARHRKMSHTADSESGKRPWDRARKAGYPSGYVGENIAMGQRDVAQVMGAWMNSSGHKRNILSGNYSECGFGVAEGGGRLYWCAVFGGSGAGIAEFDPAEMCPPGIVAEEE